MASNLDDFLVTLDVHVKTEFGSKPDVVDKGHELDLTQPRSPPGSGTRSPTGSGSCST